MSGNWDRLFLVDYHESEVAPTCDEEMVFCYWWEDMRPRDVLKLVQDAYTSGYERSQSENDNTQDGCGDCKGNDSDCGGACGKYGTQGGDK